MSMTLVQTVKSINMMFSTVQCTAHYSRLSTFHKYEGKYTTFGFPQVVGKYTMAYIRFLYNL